MKRNRESHRRQWLTGMTAALLAAFLALPSPSPASRLGGGTADPVGYACGDGYRLSVTFEKNDAGESVALVRYPEGELRLPQVRSGSGARYSDGETELWTKGDGALFTLPGSQMKRCRLVSE